MLINGSVSSNKTQILIEEYARLINSGISSNEILVLVNNSSAKERFINNVLPLLTVPCLEKLRVYSFFGLVYNTVIDNWAYLENVLKGGKPVVIPNMVGLEVSQFILKDILKDVKFEGYNSKKSLLQQLFRRYSLIIQNDLSKDEVRERAKILKESFADDAELIINKLLGVTLERRSLDYLRQTKIFNHVYKHTDYFKNIKYLLVDDADEMTPVCFDFIEYLKPQLKDWLICFDSLGSSRCGYLSADTSIEYKLKKLFNENVTEGKNNYFKNGEIIFSNILENKHEELENFTLVSLSKRAEILD